MRLHLVSLPHTQTTSAYTSCAYTQKVVKFAKMMTDAGHDVTLYAGEHNDASCSEHVPLLSEHERAGWFGEGFDTVRTPLRWDSDEPYWRLMNERAVAAIRARIDSDRDLLLVIGGWAQKPIADALPLFALEWGVGYEGIFSRFCAFESYAWMHHVYGRQGWALGRFYDAVIPNFFDPADFHLADGKSDYLLYLGRVVHRKGPHVAAMIAERCGRRLVVAGPGPTEWQNANGRPGFIQASEVRIEGNVEYAGEVGPAARAELLAGAAALITPTLYLEPFGGVTIEAMLSGTPVVTTDFGVFTETVTAEVGRRFRTLAEGAKAVDEVLTLDPAAIREHALARYSLDAVRPRFEAWFEQIHGLWGPGWDA